MTEPTLEVSRNKWTMSKYRWKHPGMNGLTPEYRWWNLQIWLYDCFSFCVSSKSDIMKRGFLRPAEHRLMRGKCRCVNIYNMLYHECVLRYWNARDGCEKKKTLPCSSNLQVCFADIPGFGLIISAIDDGCRTRSWAIGRYASSSSLVKSMCEPSGKTRARLSIWKMTSL